MNIGLIVIYIFALTNLLICANKHGKLRKGKDNFWIGLIATIINLVIVWWALGWRFW